MEINHNVECESAEQIVDRLNAGCEDEMSITGYQNSRLRTALTVLSLVLSGGTVGIILAWKSSIWLKATHRSCSLNQAQKVLLRDNDGQEFVEKVEKTKLEHNNKFRELWYFFNKKLKYVWDDKTQQFYKVYGMNRDMKCSHFHQGSTGLTTPTARTRIRFYGENSINVDVRSIPKLILDEAVNPFYIFQVYTVILWTLQLYYQFAIGVVILAAISIFVSVWETRRQSIALRNAVHSVSEVTVIRDGEETRKSSRELAPGDVIAIPPRDFTLECDAVLLNGSCIVNESSLTGESIPVTKSPVPNDERQQFHEFSHKKHILFCGTRILQTRSVGAGRVLALVLRTGFTTTKGELVRSILFPKPLELKFYSDFLKFFVVFLVLGLGAVAYSFIIWSSHGAEVLEIVFPSLDILTFVVPPILPATYTSITGFAQRRLKRHGIFCVSSKYITLCGGLDVMCFDKTGTLTEDSLDLTVVVPAKNSNFTDPVQDATHLQDSPLLQAMATCHNISLIDGQLSGYPLDLKVFEATNWLLQEPNEVPDDGGEQCSPVVVCPRLLSSKIQSDSTWIILKQYPFESGLQRMSVIARPEGTKKYHVFVKGAPEKIASLCLPKSVPRKFSTLLSHYTRLGFRVLAAASKALSETYDWNGINEMNRRDLEIDLEFAGLLILQNLLKPESSGVLNALNIANIRNVMVTGDNLLTAISVAVDSEIIADEDEVIVVEAKVLASGPDEAKKLSVRYKKYDHDNEKQFRPHKALQECKIELLPRSERFHFAIDGPSFALIRLQNRDLLHRLVHHGTVFARMLPEQKIHLVETLQHLGFQVGMCGDGANDCGALKVAHAGVSLCSAEASIASPFTSTKTNITCVPKLICEGRAALTSCIGVFKYEVSYCFSMLFMALMLFWVAVKPTDPQYVYIDMILNILPAITFGLTGPCSRLSRRRPTRKLLDVTPLASIFSFLIIQLIFYIVAWQYCHNQAWFIPFQFKPGKYETPPTYEGTAMFSSSLLSYIMAVVVFSEGSPFRKELYTNIPLTVFLIASFTASTCLIIYPGDHLDQLLSLKRPPYILYSVTLFGISIVNCLFCYFWELFVIGNLVRDHLAPFLYRLLGPSLLHEKLTMDLEQESHWPPRGTTSYNLQHANTQADMMQERRRFSSICIAPFDTTDVGLDRPKPFSTTEESNMGSSDGSNGSMGNLVRTLCWGDKKKTSKGTVTTSNPRENVPLNSIERSS